MISDVVTFVVAHQTVFGMLGVGILDLIFALVPSTEGNGILHWIFVQAQALASSGK